MTGRNSRIRNRGLKFPAAGPGEYRLSLIPLLECRGGNEPIYMTIGRCGDWVRSPRCSGLARSPSLLGRVDATLLDATLTTEEGVRCSVRASRAIGESVSRVECLPKACRDSTVSSQRGYSAPRRVSVSFGSSRPAARMDPIVYMNPELANCRPIEQLLPGYAQAASFHASSVSSASRSVRVDMNNAAPGDRGGSQFRTFDSQISARLDK